MDYSINSVDRNAWDAFVSVSPHGHFMQSFDWGVFQESSGWRPHYVHVHDGPTTRATALLLSRSLPGTGRRVFYAPRGPVFAVDDRDACTTLATALHECMRQNRGAFLRCDPYFQEGTGATESLAAVGFRSVPREWSYWNAPKFVFWLDLTPDEDALMKAVSSTGRNEIRSGYKKGVEFSLGTVDDLADFYRLMKSMSAHKGIAMHEPAYYQRLMDVLNGACAVQLFLARFEGKVVSVGMSIRYGGKAWLLYAASDSEHYKLRVNRTTQWEMIKWARAVGCYRYDFRGTATGDPPNPSDPGYGVYEFKKSFGPEFIRLDGYHELVRSAAWHGLFRFGEERVLPHAFRAKVWLDERRSRGGATKERSATE